MLIRSEHARILLELLEHRSSEGYTFSPEQINNETITELILAGMIRSPMKDEEIMALSEEDRKKLKEKRENLKMN